MWDSKGHTRDKYFPSSLRWITLDVVLIWIRDRLVGKQGVSL
jgi:hypothetical protein